MSADLDLRVYLVTSGIDDRTVEVAARAAAAGVGIVQVRAKDLRGDALFAFVARVAEAVATAAPGTTLLVDDDVEVARRARAEGLPVHGVHLGQDDLPVVLAREALGPDAIIGLTTGTLDLVRDSVAHGLSPDYIGAGPFRTTPTKDSGRPPLGVEGYPPLVAATPAPVVAIGDITPADVPALSRTGIAGVAMVRAIMTAEDPAAVVREALAAWEGVRA
ncbi:thiamine phosphate synthase [Janibacter massiliensis]|uniref:thiamine phosphate synthase n=1 Tax=Janibacter massiliensis TaxID=2058291 RepID=UPI000D0E3DAF|nr:thiamine phosphate synthase [Janibacter massiliensis]